jgi:hypothetical protein
MIHLAIPKRETERKKSDAVKTALKPSGPVELIYSRIKFPFPVLTVF